jgi:hypothetical protein
MLGEPPFRENANIDAGLRFIWRISANTKSRATRPITWLYTKEARFGSYAGNPK